MTLSCPLGTSPILAIVDLKKIGKLLGEKRPLKLEEIDFAMLEHDVAFKATANTQQHPRGLISVIQQPRR